MDVFDKMAQNITDVYNTPVMRSSGLAEYLREEFAKLQTTLDAENPSENSESTKLQNTSNSDYAAAVKNLINSEVDCVQTKNGAYVNLDGVIDCLNRARLLPSVAKQEG